MKTRRKLNIPTFESKTDEARWFDSHRRELEDEMEMAIKQGRVTRRLPVREERPVAVTILLSRDDVDAARERAAEQGIQYQTYIRVLVHQALRQKGK